MMNKSRGREKGNSQDGFTIVEFMIATAIFSLVILLCSFAIIHIGRMYYKGMITNRTQEVARTITDEITAAIQFSSGSDDPALFARMSDEVTDTDTGVVYQALCIGNIRYSFATNAVLGEQSGTAGAITSSRHVLWKDQLTGASCAPRDITEENPGGINGRELLGKGMRIPQLEIVQPANSGQAWQVRVGIAYGDDPTLFETGSDFGICKGVTAGGQFCAVSRLSTEVMKRL